MLVEPKPAVTGMEGLLGHRPELLSKFRTFYQSFWQDGLVPRRTLELCRRRIAHIHGCEAELAITDPEALLIDAEESALLSGDVSLFTPAEQVALGIAEFMPHGVHLIADAMVADADAQLGHGGCVALLTALAFFDVSCRIKLVMEVPERAGEIAADALP
jgi:hypothetical protein